MSDLSLLIFLVGMTAVGMLLSAAICNIIYGIVKIIESEEFQNYRKAVLKAIRERHKDE